MARAFEGTNSMHSLSWGGGGGGFTNGKDSKRIQKWIYSVFAPPPPKRSRCILFAPPQTHVPHFYIMIASNDTCSVTGGAYHTLGGHKRMRFPDVLIKTTRAREGDKYCEVDWENVAWHTLEISGWREILDRFCCYLKANQFPRKAACAKIQVKFWIFTVDLFFRSKKKKPSFQCSNFFERKKRAKFSKILIEKARE